VLGASCGRIDFDVRDVPTPCTWTAFGPVSALPGPIESPLDDWQPTPTLGALTLYFYSFRSGVGNGDIWVATRPDLTSEFLAPSLVNELDTTQYESAPTLTEDALDILFVRNPGTEGDVYEATRTDIAQPFTGITVLATLNSSADETDPFMSADGLRLVFSSARVASYDLYETTRPDRTSAFGAPTPIAELNTASDDLSPTLSADGLEMFFSSNRPGGPGGFDVYSAHRPAIDQPFGTAQLVSELATPGDDVNERLSLDGATLYFNSNAKVTGGNAELDIATRACQ
jgi:hypothetical protein